MKKILITGKGSYIGISLMKWLEKYPDQYQVEELDLQDLSWKEKDFSPFDVVFHVAGIAHVSTDPNLEELYYTVNRDLTIETAEKAKDEGVKQFIFMSSMIVYGDSRPELANITLDTKPRPANFYGNSKLQAEEGINKLQDENFGIVVLRPPMIYGKGSKGNYPRLSNLAQKTPIFPDIDNKRSMLHIDNLTEFIRLMMDNDESGTFFPQNKEHVKTSEMVKLISEVHNKNMRLTQLFNFCIAPFINKVNVLNKVFGDLAYDQEMSQYKQDYRVHNLKESIKLTEE